jgi:hypothetical protein
MKGIALSAVAIVSAVFAQSVSAGESFEDKLLSTPTTPDVIAKGLEADGYQLAISAYSWGYPLVRMERVARQYTEVPNPGRPQVIARP